MEDRGEEAEEEDTEYVPGGKRSHRAEMVAEREQQQSVTGRDLANRSPGGSPGDGRMELVIGVQERKGKERKKKRVGTNSFVVLFFVCFFG